MDPNVKQCVDKGDLMSSPHSYCRLVRNLNYLTITHPDIMFIVSVISQFMLAPHSTHMEAALRIVRYLKAHRGLFYGVHNHLRVEAFIDSD